MSDQDNQIDFYKKLMDSLSQQTTWPSEYLFKFIMPCEQSKIDAVKRAFSENKITMSEKLSKNNKYISLSIKSTMENPKKVVEKYQIVGRTKDIICL